MNILFASSVDPAAIDSLRASHDILCSFNPTQDELCSAIADRHVLVFRSGVQITGEVLARATRLRLILRAGSGIDNIDLDAVRSRGIRLERIPGPGARAVAEMAFALMLGLARNVLQADRLLRGGHWPKHRLSGHLLHGKVLGIVGTGNIGTQVGRLGAAWGMRVLGCVDDASEIRARQLTEAGIDLVGLDEVLRQSDYVSIHVPLKDDTRGLINATALRRMKAGAFLINMARGGVVDETALAQMLRDGHLRGAALDVHGREGEGVMSPFAGFDNVILTPHIGAQTYDSQREIGRIIVAHINALQAEC
jgi:D-3-phosphoglycerate dehydrogenase